MRLKDILGLKYPDEFIIKFFFKERLFENVGNVLELGCANGNNLSLFYNFGWNVCGVDIDNQGIDWANNNYQLYKKEINGKNISAFYVNDMINYLKKNTFKPFDVLLLPSSIYYLEKGKIEELFSLIKEKHILKPGGLMFLRIRTTRDYRNKIGRKLNKSSRLMTTNETNEKNCIITFFTLHSFIKLLDNFFYTKDLKVMNSNVENFVHGKLIFNSDIIIWGNLQNK